MLKRKPTNRATAADLCRQIVRNIRRFDRRTARIQQTDTGEAWELLNDIADRAMRAARVLQRGRP